jgi:hypothetical protein
MILRTEPGTAGDWTVAAVGEAVLALPGTSAESDDLIARLAGPDGFRAALERIVVRGISAAPDFALVDFAAGVVRVVLRGPAEVEAAAGADVRAERISGAGVTTWTERVLEGVEELRLRVPGSSWTLGAGAGAGGASAVVSGAAMPSASAAPGRPVAREDAAPHATLAPPRDEPLAAAPMPVTAVPPAPPEAATAETIGSTDAGSPRDAGIDAGTGPDADPDAEPYAFLFGDTVYRTIGGADVRIPNPDPARPGDHDGRTVLVDELVAHEQGDLPAAPPAVGPVLALQLPDGALEPLDAPLLVGRAPSDPGHDASGGTPRLVTIASDDKDISRTHARIEVAGGAVVVTDLDSRNGTSVTLPGGVPRTLRAGEPAVVLPDTVIDLGGGVVITVRESA